MNEWHTLELIAEEVIKAFEINAPPIPIEKMLQHPKPDMWEDLDISQISVNFLKVTNYYSPRMSLARLLARQLCASRWGSRLGLDAIWGNEIKLHRFTRMLVMPSSMITELTLTARTPSIMSVHFEVPLDDARLRLEELNEAAL
ncbi:MAG: hypothetical protein CUN53_00585 [Phototrophicales bacterium]|nr:MAG: hypothetical protein CUN53_00585 [Phototrophicales bacterium]